MKISVALCTCNGEKYLRKQLESFSLQTRIPDELIVCDDNSTDKTLAILEEFKTSASFKVSIVLNSPRLGVIKNFEKAISLCSGDIIFLSDQDDIWEPQKLEVLKNVFECCPDTLMVFCNGQLIDQQDRLMGSTLWDKWHFTKEIREQWLDNEEAFGFLIRNDNKITGATAAIHSEMKKYIFPFKVPNGYWHDCWLGIFAARYNGLRFVDQQLIRYRVHPNQLVGIGNGKSLNNNRGNNFFLSIYKLFERFAK